MTTLLEDRPSHAVGAESSAPAHEVVVRVVSDGGSGDSGGSGRAPRRRGFGGFRTVGILAGLGAIAVAVVLLANAIGGFRISLFGTSQIDRSAPVVLKQLRERVHVHRRDRRVRGDRRPGERRRLRPVVHRR